MVGGGLLACLPRQIIPTKNILSLLSAFPFGPLALLALGPLAKIYFLLECFGDHALDGLNLLLICHALRFGVARGTLKDSLAPVDNAKDASVGFLLERGRCPVSAELYRASEPVFGFVTPRVQWREVQLFARLIHVCATEGAVSTQVAHGVSLLV